MDMISKTLLLISIFLVPILSEHANALGVTDEGYYVCHNETLDLSQQNKLSTTALLSDLAAHSSTNSFYHSSSSAGGKSTTTYGLFYCTADASSQACDSCVKAAATTLTNHCRYYKAAVVFDENCTMRYSNSPVYAIPDKSVVSWLYTIYTISYSGFNETRYATLNSLISEAPYSSKGFATGEAKLVGTTEKLYALAQCTPDILGSPCQDCLELALQLMPSCCKALGSQRRFLMTSLPSCQLRYEVKYPSKSDASPSSSPGKMWINVWYILVSLAVAFY